MGALQYFLARYWRAGVEILVLAVIFYAVLKFLRGTRGAGILKGLGVVVVLGLIGVLFLARFLELNVIATIATEAVGIFSFALLVIFQPEVRRALVRLGQSPLFGFFARSHKEVTNQIVDAVTTMSREQIGALVAIEREVGLRSYAEGGVRLDAEVTASLLVTLFHATTPLHDGAAIGVTEDSDALAIVVSEETGNVSIAVKGQMTRDLDPEGLRMILRSLYTPTPA